MPRRIKLSLQKKHSKIKEKEEIKSEKKLKSSQKLLKKIMKTFKIPSRKKMNFVRHTTKHNMSLNFRMKRTDGSEVCIDSKKILREQQKTSPQELRKKEQNLKTEPIHTTKKLKLVTS